MVFGLGGNGKKKSVVVDPPVRASSMDADDGGGGNGETSKSRRGSSLKRTTSLYNGHAGGHGTVEARKSIETIHKVAERRKSLVASGVELHPHTHQLYSAELGDTSLVHQHSKPQLVLPDSLEQNCIRACQHMKI